MIWWALGGAAAAVLAAGGFALWFWRWDRAKRRRLTDAYERARATTMPPSRRDPLARPRYAGLQPWPKPPPAPVRTIPGPAGALSTPVPKAPRVPSIRDSSPPQPPLFDVQLAPFTWPDSSPSPDPAPAAEPFHGGGGDFGGGGASGSWDAPSSGGDVGGGDYGGGADGGSFGSDP